MSLSARHFDSNDRSKKRVDRRVVILCEGVDDAYFIDQICIEIGAKPEDVGIAAIHGDGEFLKNLNDLIKTSPFVTGNVKRLIIIRDSDLDGQKRTAELSKEVIKIGLPALKHGELVKFTHLDVERELGYFSIPDLEVLGAVEALLLSTVENEARYIRSKAVLEDDISESGDGSNFDKRLARIYLALNGTKWRGVGSAYKAGVFPSAHVALNPIRDFLSQACA
jgi:hypothetical protein